MIGDTFRKICPPRALSLLTALAAVFVLLPALPRMSHADAFTYGTGASRTVNAGILLLDETTPSVGNPAAPSPSGPDNSDPYVFDVLNERTDIKPLGWSIVNPLAPKDVTAAIQLRWDSRANATVYQIGQNITPAMAPYWEVSLSTASSDDLAQFDILLINLIKPVSFTVADSEKLRRFVDGGGTLWIENSGPNVGAGTAGGDVNDAVGPLFFHLNFNNPASASGTTNYATIPSASRNPIISTPYQLSEQELSSLGDKHIGDYYSYYNAANATKAAPGPGFTTVVGNSGYSSLPVIAAQQYGAGQIIVTCTGSANTINNYVGGTNIGFGYNSGPYSGINYTNAPSQDLKLLSDIISADSHPAERLNSHQTGNAVNALTSPALSWNAAVAPAANPAIVPGAVVDGHIAYVTGADGVLRAYDIYPGEDLDGDGNPNDGDTSQDVGQPFDLLWQVTVGQYASAPTVAAVNGKTYVLVEDATGQVYQFDTTAAFTAIPGTLAKLGSGAAGATYGSNAATGSAPAPTFFGGRVYAGRPDGTLFVWDYNTTASAGSGQVYTPFAGANGEFATASPTVGLLPQDNGGTGSDIIAFLPTNTRVYSIYLGARGEQLTPLFSPFSTKLKNNAQIDASVPPTYRTYTINNGGLPTIESLTPAGKQFQANNGMIGTPPVFADYDPNFAVAASVPQSLTRSYVNVGGTGNAQMSAPALDGHGNIYYISFEGGRSTLSSFHDATTAVSISLNWRFQLPRMNDPAGYVVDADGTNYRALALGTAQRDLTNYRFVGAPVADSQGLVYALATNGQQTAVLCFSGLGSVSADILPPGDETQVNNVKVFQPDPMIPGQDLFGNMGPPQINGNQFTIGGTGHIDIRSFGRTNTANNTNMTDPDMAEPYPITVSFTYGGGNANAAAGSQQTLVRLHTNLSWYTILPTSAGAATSGGFTKVGNRLFFVGVVTVNGVPEGDLESVVADPAAEGFTIGLKYVPPVQASGGSNIQMWSHYANTAAGLVTGVPCASNGAIIVNGTGGASAFTNQITVVVDSNRVMEVDSNGDAQWVVDSTSKTALAGDTAPIYSGGAGQLVTTTLELNRPSSLYELTQNDYLVADTGNNRCVRFDRSGKVIWELTKFNDPNNLLTPGEPNTLNQPTSVQVSTRSEPGSTNLYVRYLISDTGNDRVLEVDDIYAANGTPVLPFHTLGWISRTHDTQGRQYRYQSASYYYIAVGNSVKSYVAALVTNTRVATPLPLDASNNPTGALLPANQDAPGGSIVLLDYDTSANPVATNGLITAAINSFSAPLTAAGAFDAANGTATTLLIHNPRYLKTYVPAGAAATSAKNFLLADDNGVWDLQATNTGYAARFGFTDTDYKVFAAPLQSGPLIFKRTKIPFVPSSVQLLGIGTAGTGRYLITNSLSQGEAGNDTSKMSGEVFEIDQGTAINLQGGGYNSHTLSRPSNTSALSQPAFAYRLQ